MPLASLADDVVFEIASTLDLEDLVSLSHTCKSLQWLLEENPLLKRIVKAWFPHSREAALAEEGTISYIRAARSIHERRDALANAYPFSARIAGQGTAFVYRQGILCLLRGTMLQILDLYASCEVLALDVRSIIPSSPYDLSAAPEVSLLYYSDGMVAVHRKKDIRSEDESIFVISTKLDTPEEERLISGIALESSHRLFVRHNERYLYYGTYSGIGDHGHHEWQIRGTSLDVHYPLPYTEALQFVDFFGTEIGSTVAFEMHQDWFYAVSNQTSFDVEELDWTSFYHCIRFPLDNPILNAMEIEPRVYRRQHAEGPIHDSWIDLTLQPDSCSNELRIVEARREWHIGSSRQSRTFYISNPLSEAAFPSIPEPKARPGRLDPGVGTSRGPLPPNDPLTHLVGVRNNPHWAPTEPRYNVNVHPEFSPASKKDRSFILARTKFRAYSSARNSFVELVEDDRCCNGPLALPCLRLRAGWRRVAPHDWCSPDPAAPAPDKNDVLYRHSTAKMFPPSACSCTCSKRLHHIMNPPLEPSQCRTITAAADEHFLIYMVSHGRPSSDLPLGTIVILNFNNDSKECSSVAGQKQGNDTATSQDYWQWQPGHHTVCEKGECSRPSGRAGVSARIATANKALEN